MPNFGVDTETGKVFKELERRLSKLYASRYFLQAFMTPSKSAAYDAQLTRGDDAVAKLEVRCSLLGSGDEFRAQGRYTAPADKMSHIRAIGRATGESSMLLLYCVNSDEDATMMLYDGAGKAVTDISDPYAMQGAVNCVGGRRSETSVDIALERAVWTADTLGEIEVKMWRKRIETAREIDAGHRN